MNSFHQELEEKSRIYQSLRSIIIACKSQISQCEECIDLISQMPFAYQKCFEEKYLAYMDEIARAEEQKLAALERIAALKSETDALYEQVKQKRKENTLS